MIFIKPQLTPYELAGVLNISASAAYALCRDPTFPAYKLGVGKNSNWRIDPDDLQDWIESKKVINITIAAPKRKHRSSPSKKAVNGYTLNWD
ncbi:MAG: helix-turn-helix domain-containing protein [Syntrophomonas sp.]